MGSKIKVFLLTNSHPLLQVIDPNDDGSVRGRRKPLPVSTIFAFTLFHRWSERCLKQSVPGAQSRDFWIRVLRRRRSRVVSETVV